MTQKKRKQDVLELASLVEFMKDIQLEMHKRVLNCEEGITFAKSGLSRQALEMERELIKCRAEIVIKCCAFTFTAIIGTGIALGIGWLVFA